MDDHPASSDQANPEKNISGESSGFSEALKNLVAWILKPVVRSWESLNKPEASNRVVAVATVVIAVATLVSTYEIVSSSAQTDKIVTASQKIQTALETANSDYLSGLQRTLSQSQRNADVSNAQNQKAMDATNAQSKATLQTTVDQNRLEQRAWVGVLDADAQEFSETDGLKAVVIFFNSGRTPARNVQISSRYILSPVPIAGPSPEEVKNLIFRPGSSIAPQGRFNEGLGQSYTGEPYTESQLRGRQALISRFQDIKTKKATLYFFGILKYDDIFGNHRETHYCVYLADPEKKDMAYCDAFNDVH